MGSLEVPSWVGPVVTPILLILFILTLCFYYCYWIPRRKRNKQAKGCEKDEKHSSQPCQVRYVDECYVDHYSSNDLYSFGMVYTDCPLPVSNGLVYHYRPKEYSPTKVFYYPKRPDIPTKSFKRDKNAQNDCILNAKLKNVKMQKCKVKCAKGQCLKCPELPIIVEGDSLIEEEENIDKEECNCIVECPLANTSHVNTDKVLVVQCAAGSDSSNGSSLQSTVVGHDSGYED